MGRKTLIVDDNKEILDLLVTCLAEQRFDVKPFESADAAMDACSNDDLHDFDFIVTDFDMPGTRGDEFAVLMHSLNPDSNIFIISGTIKNVSSEARQVATLVEKPFSFAGPIQKMIAQERKFLKQTA